MLTGLPLSIIILVIVAVFFVIDYGFMNQFDRERSSRKGWSWDYTLFSIAVGLAIILQPWLLPSLTMSLPGGLGIGLQILGLLLAVLSLGMHVWARMHLRQFYVERVELQQGHQVIQTGPYAYVRHPIFTTFFGLAIATILLNPSIVTLVVSLFTFWDFTRAAKQEDELLMKNLPDYADYIRRVPRFFPRLRGRS